MQLDYPRVCGGTLKDSLEIHRERGLSPRVRGNRAYTPEALQAFRTIPACAGEPKRSGNGCGIKWDYPRVCGGT